MGFFKIHLNKINSFNKRLITYMFDKFLLSIVIFLAIYFNFNCFYQLNLSFAPPIPLDK